MRQIFCRMDTKNTNQDNMIESVITFCETNANPAIIHDVPLLETTLEKVNANQESIELLEATASGSTKGVTSDTNTLRRIMTDYGIRVSSAVYAYAWSLEPPNETLADSLDYMPTDFTRMVKAEVDDVCAKIHAIATSILASLDIVNITAPVLAAFGASIDNYSAAIQKPRIAIVNRSVAKEQVTNLIDSTIKIQFGRIMDRLALSLKMTSPTFYEGYMNSRKTVDLGSTFTKFRGTANDTNGNPLQNATATLTKIDEPELVYTSKSNNLGKFANVVVKPGDYNIVFVCAGKKSQTINPYHFAPGSEEIHHIIFIPE